MMKEIYGRRDGLCHGKGARCTSRHVQGHARRQRIVGGGPPLAVGAAIPANCAATAASAWHSARRQRQSGHRIRGDEHAVVLARAGHLRPGEQRLQRAYGAATPSARDLAGRSRAFGMRPMRRWVRFSRHVRCHGPARWPTPSKAGPYTIEATITRTTAISRAIAELPREGRSRAPAREHGLPETVSRSAPGPTGRSRNQPRCDRFAGGGADRFARGGIQGRAPPWQRTSTPSLHQVLTRDGSTMPQLSCATRSTRPCIKRWPATSALLCSAMMLSGGREHFGQREASGGIFGVTKGLLPRFGEGRCSTRRFPSRHRRRRGRCSLRLRPVAEIIVRRFHRRVHGSGLQPDREIPLHVAAAVLARSSSVWRWVRE